MTCFAYKITAIYSKFCLITLTAIWWKISLQSQMCLGHQCQFSNSIFTDMKQLGKQRNRTSLTTARSSPFLHYQHNSEKYNYEQQDASNDSSNFNCVVCLFLRFWDWFWSGSSWRWKEMRRKRWWVRENKDVTFKKICCI